MADVVLFHHAQGLTPGVVRFADDLRTAGHTVHTPDLFEGHTFDSLDEGLAYAREVGFQAICDNGVRLGEELPVDVFYAGFSMGGMPAQQLAQTRPGARGALFFHSAITPEEFGSGWPEDVPVQIHAMDADPFFMEEGGDIDAAREIVAAATSGELHLYPGAEHLFTDSSLPAYDAEATALVTARTLAFLAER